MRIYLGHFCKADKERELGISVAASNFSNTLVCGDFFDRSYSILPPFVTGKRNAKELASKNTTLLYSAWRRFPSPFSRLAPVIEQLTLFFKIPRKSSIWLYNVTMLNWILIKLLCWFKPSVKIYPIILDYTPGLPGNHKFLKFINNSAGRISLTHYSEISKVNFRCLPGITPKESAHPHINSPKPTFLLSGVLSEEISSISTVVEAFASIPDATLNITGNLSHNRALIDKIAHIPNINYLGMLSKEEYNNLLDFSTTFILSTRDPNFPENQCNFPSKIIEGLLHNKGVISTISYPQIEGVNYIKTHLSVNDLKVTIREIISMTNAQIEQYINQGEKVVKMFSTDIWKSAIEEIEKPYDAIYLTNTPSFYKLNLMNAIGNAGYKLLIVFYGYGDEAVNTILTNDSRHDFDWTFLSDGDASKRNKLNVFLNAYRLIRQIKHKKILYAGWFVPEYNLISLSTPRHKNILICESSIYETKTSGVKGLIKRIIIGRMHSALPSGQPHKQLLTKLKFSGEQFITGSVGIFDKQHLRDDAHSKCNSDKLTFLYVGRLVSVKNIEILIECFNRNGLPLTIVGDGVLKDALKTAAKNNIKFLGFVNNDQLYRIYQSHDVFILPSKSEPWGLVVEEALYNGLPVITSDKVGAYTDMIEQYDAGESFRYDSAESLQIAINNVTNNYRKYCTAVKNIDFKQREQQQIQAYIDAFQS